MNQFDIIHQLKNKSIYSKNSIPSTLALNVANIVEALRDLRGIKQFELADALKIDRSTYSRIEHGHRPFDLAELEIIAKILRTNVLQIILLADTSVIVEDKIEPLSKIFSEIVSQIKQAQIQNSLSEEDICKVLTKIRELKLANTQKEKI